MTDLPARSVAVLLVLSESERPLSVKEVARRVSREARPMGEPAAMARLQTLVRKGLVKRTRGGRQGAEVLLYEAMAAAEKHLPTRLMQPKPVAGHCPACDHEVARRHGHRGVLWCPVCKVSYPEARCQAILERFGGSGA